MEPSRPRIPLGAWIAFALAAAVWAWHVVRNLAIHLRFEDAMIVLRYARNLVEGNGFVFNPGERVLGVTTPLHTLVSTLWVVLGGENAPAWQNVAGVAWLVAQAALAMALLGRLGRPWVALPVALLLLGNFNPTYLYFGMETHAFAALVLLALYLHVDPDEPRPVVLGVVLGLAFLLRYDAALLALLVGLERLARDRRPPIALTVAFFVVVTPWLLFAQLYFGSILPQPLAAKDGYLGAFEYLRHVHEFYRDTFARVLGALLPGDLGLGRGALVVPWIGLGGAVAAVASDRRFLVPALYPALHVATYAALGSDPGFTWHYYLLNPLGFLFVALGFEEIARVGWRIARRLLGDRLPADRLARPLAWIAVALVTVPLLAHLDRQMRHRYRPDPLTVQLTSMGTWLREHYPPETSILHPAIGILGWESRLRIVDHAGLVTPGLYFYDDLRATPLEEVVSVHSPDLILLSQWSQEDPSGLGYEVIQVFEAPFVYKIYGRS